MSLALACRRRQAHLACGTGLTAAPEIALQTMLAVVKSLQDPERLISSRNGLVWAGLDGFLGGMSSCNRLCKGVNGVIHPQTFWVIWLENPVPIVLDGGGNQDLLECPGQPTKEVAHVHGANVMERWLRSKSGQSGVGS